MNFQCAAVDDAGLSNKIIGRGRVRQKQEHQYNADPAHAHDLDVTTTLIHGISIGTRTERRRRVSCQFSFLTEGAHG